VTNELEGRLTDICEEIRRYPTPIARCDEHLTALLEERSRLVAQLKSQGGCTSLALWINDGGFNAA